MSDEILVNENTQNDNTQNEETSKKKTNGGIVQTLYETTSVVVTSILMIALIFTFVFRLVGVNGDSMLSTLHTGDWLIVAPYYSEPEYGDIVISTKETAAQGSLVKRVIAVAGDEVVIENDGTVIVNGIALDEDSYTLDDGIRRGNLEYPVTVPENCVMLMGDNRIVSWDSRFEEIGFAETQYLLGKALVRLSPDYNIYANFNN